MVANTGTYLDSPFHRFADGKDLADLPLGSLAGLDGLLVRAPAVRRAISRDVFEGLSLSGRAVLVHTGWDLHWRTDAYFEGHPFLTLEAAQFLRESRVKLVGIDSYNIDDTADLNRPVHTILLGNEIPIVEHMTGLAKLPPEGFKFYAVPPKVRAFGTFPVRAITEHEVRVEFHRRAHLPIVLASGLCDKPVAIPWWSKRRLRLTTYTGR